MPSKNAVPLDLATSSERYKAGWVDGTVQVTIFLLSTPLMNQLLSRFDLAEFTVLWMLFFFLGYENIPVCLWGQTLGQKICGLKVVDREGNTPKVLPILYRWLLKMGTRGYRRTSQGETLNEVYDRSTGVFVVHAR